MFNECNAGDGTEDEQGKQDFEGAGRPVLGHVVALAGDIEEQGGHKHDLPDEFGEIVVDEYAHDARACGDEEQAGVVEQCSEGDDEVQDNGCTEQNKVGPEQGCFHGVFFRDKRYQVRDWAVRCRESGSYSMNCCNCHICNRVTVAYRVKGLSAGLGAVFNPVRE